VTLYGFVEADLIYDTTRSYNDSIGSALVARKENLRRTEWPHAVLDSHTRLGFALESPQVGPVKPSAVLEADFFGHQDTPPATSEVTYFSSPVLRLRHAFVKLENPYVNVLMGQTYDVFGWQNYFSPCSLEFLGLPNQLFSRNMQLRASHTFYATGAVSLDVAASAVRPAQRDAEVPDGNAACASVSMAGKESPRPATWAPWRCLSRSACRALCGSSRWMDSPRPRAALQQRDGLGRVRWTHLFR